MTVLFADLVGFTTRSERQDPEEVASFLSDYFERSRAVIDHFGGVVDKYAGDAVMAVWGAHIANEDDAERAVRAGLELQQTVAKLAADAGDPDITLRVGVHTGEAAVKPGGNQSTGMIVGDLVNSAARLQTAAEPGTVLVGEATYLAARDAIAFEEAGTPELKGKLEPVRTWRALRVVAERRGYGRVQGLDPPFVGRRDELQLLKDLLTGVARDKRARMVSIVGEVGIGKSRLVWELQKYADGLAAPVFWNQGRSSAYGAEGVASRALSDMLRGRIGVTEGDDDDIVPRRLMPHSTSSSAMRRNGHGFSSGSARSSAAERLPMGTVPNSTLPSATTSPTWRPTGPRSWSSRICNGRTPGCSTWWNSSPTGSPTPPCSYSPSLAPSCSSAAPDGRRVAAE